MSQQNTPVPSSNQFRNHHHSVPEQSLHLEDTIAFTASPSLHAGQNQNFLSNSYLEEVHEDPVSGLFQSTSRELDLLQSPARLDATHIHPHQSPTQSLTHHDPNAMVSVSNHGVNRAEQSQIIQHFQQPNQEQIRRHQPMSFQSYQPLLQQLKFSSQQPQTHPMSEQSQQTVTITRQQRQFLQIQRMQSQSNHIQAQEMLAQMQQNQGPSGPSPSTVVSTHSRPYLSSSKGDTLHAVQRPVPILPATANMMPTSGGAIHSYPNNHPDNNTLAHRSDMTGMFSSVAQAVCPTAHPREPVMSSQPHPQQYHTSLSNTHPQQIRPESEITPQTSGSISPPIPEARKKCKGKSKMQQPRVSTEEAVRLAATMDRPPTRKSSKGGWTAAEDDALRVVVMEHSEKNWKDIAKALNRKAPGSCRNDVQCLHRWQKVLQPGLKKGPWTPHEDETITRLVGELGANKWSLIAKQLPGRIGKQCRERWFNHLNPEINKAPWTPDEEQILQEAHAKVGNKWAIIAKYLPGRTDNAIKNHYNATKRRAATRKGRKSRGKLTPSSSPSLANTSSTTTPASASQTQAFANMNAPSIALPNAVAGTSILPTVQPSSSFQSQPTGSDSITPISISHHVRDEIDADLTNGSELVPSRPLCEITNSQRVGTMNPTDGQNKKRPHRSLSTQPTKRAKSDRSSHGGEEENSNPKQMDCEVDEDEIVGVQQMTSALDTTVDTANATPALCKEGSVASREGCNRDATHSTSQLQSKDSSDTSRYILEGLPEMRLDTPGRGRGQSDSGKKDLSQIVTIEVGDAIVTPVKMRTGETNDNDIHANNSNSQNPSNNNVNELQSKNVAGRTKDSDDRVLQSTNHALLFSTPPRRFFSNLHEGSGTLGQESPNFAIRTEGMPGILGVTPMPRSPLFLSSSPCGMSGYRGLISSEARTRELGSSGAALFTPGGLFGSTPCPRGRLSAICEGLGGGSSATPTRGSFREPLLPPLFSPPPGTTPGNVALAELKESTATKGRLSDSEVRLASMDFTLAPAEDFTDGWTKRQLFGCMTPQQPRRPVDFGAGDENIKRSDVITDEEGNDTDEKNNTNAERTHSDGSEGLTGDIQMEDAAFSENATGIENPKSTAGENQTGIKESCSTEQADRPKETTTVSGDTDRK